MTLTQAQQICGKINAKYIQRADFGKVSFSDVYDSEEELLSDLANIYIPAKRVAPVYTFRGYEYVYSFAYYVQRGWTLSTAQLRQAKRLALEIRKAASISDYRF